MQDDLVERVAAELCRQRGFGYYTDPMEGGQDAYEISNDAYREAAAVIPMILEEAAKVVEGFIDGGGGPGDGVAELAAERIRAIGAP